MSIGKLPLPHPYVCDQDRFSMGYKVLSIKKSDPVQKMINEGQEAAKKWPKEVRDQYAHLMSKNIVAKKLKTDHRWHEELNDEFLFDMVKIGKANRLGAKIE